MPERNSMCIGYCGLACGLCKNACVPDCRSGGGPEECVQRKCCVQKGLDGCWACEGFPCNRGFFEDGDDPAFRGICIGSVRAVSALGAAEYLRRVGERLGNPVEYGEYRYLDPEDVSRILCHD